VRAIAMARFPFFPLAFRFLAPSFALSFRAYLSFFSGHFQKCLTAFFCKIPIKCHDEKDAVSWPDDYRPEAAGAADRGSVSQDKFFAEKGKRTCLARRQTV